MSETDNFHIQLSLARMAAGLCGRNKSDLGATGTIHQIRRLSESYFSAGQVERAAKLQNIVDWFEAGAIPDPTIAVLSETGG